MIRPIDLQMTIISAQHAPSVQRAEEAPRTAAAAVQAAFAAEVTRRDETVAATTEVPRARIGDKPEERPKRGDRGRKHPPRTAFEQLVDDAAASAEDAPHLVDFTA